MNRRAIIMTIVLFALIVVGMFVFAYLKQQEIQVDPVEEVTTGEGTVAGDRYSNITRVNAKHFFIDGVHTLVGEIAMPTPCDLLESSHAVAESLPEQVTVDFAVINNSENCIQQITPARFKESIAASEQASFHSHFQGRHIELNLIPAAPGETPDEFELFIKG